MLAVAVRAKAAGPACPGPGPLDEPGVAGWAGPPSNDGSLDDGYVPVFDGGGNILDYLGVRPSTPLPAPFAYNGVQSPYPDATACMAYDAQGHPSTHSCLCTKCFQLTQECDSLPGCKAILKCAEDSGCTDANSCYLLPGAPCVQVINDYGTGSVSTALEQMLRACGASNGCPTQ
jgi:hypothetical protein